MWPFGPRPAREAPRSAGWSPMRPAAPVRTPGPVPPTRATSSLSTRFAARFRTRPTGFTILAVLLGIAAPLMAVALMRENHPATLAGALHRLAAVSTLASAAVLAIGLWRCERWVGKVAAAWAGLLAAHMAVLWFGLLWYLGAGEAPALDVTVAAALFTLLSATPLAAVAWYVRRRNRKLWPTP